MNHHAVQRALVRMLYDPAFAHAVERGPGTTDLDEETRRAVAAVDPRALRADPLRRLRTLGTLAEEFRIGTALALAETRSRAFLESFYAGPEFHRSVEERTPLALAYGAFLAAACRDGRLREARTPAVVHLETMQARARRAVADVVRMDHFSSVRLAPGVVHGRLSGSVFDTIARVEKILFEVSLLPALALCSDPPRLALPPADAALPALSLLVVPAASGLAVVTLDAELDAVMTLLADGAPHAMTALSASLAPSLGAARADALIAELLDEEVLSPAP